MIKEHAAHTSFGVGPRGGDSQAQSQTENPPMEVPFTKKRLTMLAAAVIIISVSFGIQLAQYLAYLKHDSESARFGSMYEYILKTNISFIESLTIEDKPAKLPSLDNHIYFINFGQILRHDDPNLSRKLDDTLGRLRLIQDNYEFQLENLISYEAAHSIVEPEWGNFRVTPDPVVSYNGERIPFSEYKALKQQEIRSRQEQLTKILVLLKQYLNEYQQMSALLQVGDA